ncbi:hypothetical protein [Mesorhizobium sp. 1B3]|uniref:hypothetical protein n=1 Tax=Mesorhizobium sp. 1B3 TaxID=3243599 RepID=UPI003D9555FB
MSKPIPDGIFKPKPTSTEAKNDTTTRIARSIIEDEAAKRDAKTQRLRHARLAREAQTELTTPAKRLAARRRNASGTA